MRGRNFPLISLRNLIFLWIVLYKYCRFSLHVRRFSSTTKAMIGQFESSRLGHFHFLEKELADLFH